jgi:hypothetical protein|tara:strand:+ start:354 stop:539 length:186 start_codon:yes stop_codon:yes gene_type:complete
VETKKPNKKRIYIDGGSMKVDYRVYNLLKEQTLKIQQYEAILAAYLKEKEEKNQDGKEDND